MDMEGLFCNAECSDLALLVEGQRIPSHKLVLARRSEYFRNLVFTCQDELELKDTPISSFIVVLQHIYTGRIANDTKLDLLPNVLELAHRFRLLELEQATAERIKKSLDQFTFPFLFEKVRLLDWSDVPEACLRFAEDNAKLFIESKVLLRLSSESLYDVISRDSFFVPEVAIFEVVSEWHEHHPDVDLAPVLSAVRLTQMKPEEMISVVLPSRLFPTHVILEATQQRNKGSVPRYLRVADEDIFNTVRCPNIVEIKSNPHSDKDDIDILDNPPNVELELQNPFLLNCIIMNIDKSWCSYYVELSINKEEWTKVIDYSEFMCRDLQFLWFKPQAVKYIRISCTRSEKFNRSEGEMNVLPLEDFYCSYNPNPTPFRDGVMYAQRGKTRFYSGFEDVGSRIGRCTQPVLADTIKIPGFAGSIRVRGRDELWQEVKSREGEKGCFRFQLREVFYIEFCPKAFEELDVDALCEKVVCLAMVVPTDEPKDVSEPKEVPAEDVPPVYAPKTAAVEKHQPAPWNMAMALVMCFAVFVALMWLDRQ